MTRSTTISFAIDWSIAIDALGTPAVDILLYAEINIAML